MSLMRLLRFAEVVELTGFARSKLYRMIADGAFPPPLKIGVKSVRFRDDDIHAWIDSLPTHSELIKGRQ